MSIIDINAWIGSGFSHRVAGSVEQVMHGLAALGVSRACLTPMDAVWHHNPHLANGDVYRAAAEHPGVLAVPLLDPTVATWTDELERAVGAKAAMVKLIPGYAGYDLDAASPLLDRIEGTGLPVLVQVRLQDPRHQHPRAQVPDFPAGYIARMARQRTGLRVVIGGASTASILALRDELLELPNLYADLSQADGMDAARRMVRAGMLPRLLFGTHAPLFEPLAGLARVLPDLDDASAAAILHGNAARLLDL